MCDQTEVQYLPGEVVWVKLRALWWPGLVQDYDSLPEEITSSLRKRPIATVKFFQEDSYEYVHKLDLIYHYNCSRKLDFIKKGLDLCRKKTADRPATMDFFPADVVTAEELTDGDPNILQDESFKPEEKPKIGSIFGSEKKKFGKKKGKEDSPLKDKSARRKKLASKLQEMGWLSRGITANIIYPSPDTPRIVTHRRFLNKVRNPDAKSDYEVRIMEQKCEDEPSSLADKKYQCVLCGYLTCRLNVIVMHFNTTHSRRAKNIFPIPSIIKGGSFRTPLLKMRESVKSAQHSKKRNSVKVEKEKQERSDEEDHEEEIKTPQPVKKEKGKPGRKRKVKPEWKDQDAEGEDAKKPKVLDTLLADWEEDMEQETEEQEQEKLLQDDDEDDSVDQNMEDGETPVPAGSSISSTTLAASKSKEVFEFVDDEEDGSLEFDRTPTVKGFGRRIPRVIETSKEKKRASEAKKSTKTKPNKKEKDVKDDIVDEFESLLAETSLPSIPSIPKSSNFSLDVDEDMDAVVPPQVGDSGTKEAKADTQVDDSGLKSVRKEQNEGFAKSAALEKGEMDGEEPKNSEPEVELAVNPKIPPQVLEKSSTAKASVQVVEDSAVSNKEISELKAKGKLGQTTSGGDHTYVSGTSGRKRRRSLLPLDKNEGSLDIMSMPVVMGDDFMVEEAPRVNKQPMLPQVVGSKVVSQPTPRRVGRPPKNGSAASKASKSVKKSKNDQTKSSKKSPPHQSSKSSSYHRSSKNASSHQSSKSPPAYHGPKSPVIELTPRSPLDRSPKSSTHRHGSKSPSVHQSPKKEQGYQSPKSPHRASMSPDAHRGPKSPQPYQGPKSPLILQSPKSPQPYRSPGHQSPKSPQSFLGPKSPPMSVQTVPSPKSPQSPARISADMKNVKSPPQSPVKTTAVDSQFLSGSKSPVRVLSPQGSPVSHATLLSQEVPSRSVVKTPSLSPVTKASASLKKTNTSTAVIVQSKPDLQPESYGLGKLMAAPPLSIASGSSGSLKTIKVAVSSSPGSSPVILGKTVTPAGTTIATPAGVSVSTAAGSSGGTQAGATAGSPNPQTRRLIMVQGKGVNQKMVLTNEASQQLLQSGKKFMVITKNSSGKLVLSPQQQKLLAGGGKVTTSSGQIINSKGGVLSSITKLVTTKASTSGASGTELSTEPPALVKTDSKKTYKIITSPQSKGGNILLNTPGGKILVPVSTIGASGSGGTTLSGSKQILLPVGAKNMKLLNTAGGGGGQKFILQMKSSPAKPTLTTSPKSVQPIVPKTIQSGSLQAVQTVSPKAIQPNTPKAVQQISPKTVSPITPRTIQPITPKTSQPMKVTPVLPLQQPLPQLQPLSSLSKGVKPKVVKGNVVKQAKSPRKGSALAKAMEHAAIIPSSSTLTTPVVLPSTSPQKRSSSILPIPSLKQNLPQPKLKKISLAAKLPPVETASVSPMPATVQVMTSAVPALEPIQTTLLPSIETSSTVSLPTSTQQLVAVPTEDGGQVMYLIDNSSLLNLDGSNQANLGNLILTFDNMGQPTVSSAAPDFTFAAPSSGQDILAEALANTQVLQSETSGGDLGLDTSGLLSSHASSSMYAPTLSHGVLETSLTLNQPIMTPLEDLSAVSTLQPPPVPGAATTVDLPITITQPDITISTSSYASLPIPSATIQSTVFSEAQHISTFSTAGPDTGSVFLETPTSVSDSLLTSDNMYEPASEGASMPLLDG